MGKAFDEDFKLSKFMHFFNGIVCDKAVGDTFLTTLQSMRQLTDFTNKKKTNCPSIEEIIKATTLLQENILLKKGIDLLFEPTQQEVTHYLEVLKRNNPNDIIVHHQGRALTEKEAMQSLQEYIQSKCFSLSQEKNSSRMRKLF